MCVGGGRETKKVCWEWSSELGLTLTVLDLVNAVH